MKKSKSWAYADRDPIWKIWASIRARCYTKSREDYRRYGAIGIKMCPAWEKFEIFREWAIANGFKEGLRLIRRSKKKSFSPSNCRFCTVRDMGFSRRYVRKLPNGKTTVEAGKDIGLSRGVVGYRLRSGWSQKDAISIPNQGKRLADFKILEIRASTKNQRSLAAQYRVDPAVISRIKSRKSYNSVK